MPTIFRKFSSSPVYFSMQKTVSTSPCRLNLWLSCKKQLQGRHIFWEEIPIQTLILSFNLYKSYLDNSFKIRRISVRSMAKEIRPYPQTRVAYEKLGQCPDTVRGHFCLPYQSDIFDEGYAAYFIDAQVCFHINPISQGHAVP